jgi:hypothetical protein
VYVYVYVCEYVVWVCNSKFQCNMNLNLPCSYDINDLHSHRRISRFGSCVCVACVSNPFYVKLGGKVFGIRLHMRSREKALWWEVAEGGRAREREIKSAKGPCHFSFLILVV